MSDQELRERLRKALRDCPEAEMDLDAILPVVRTLISEAVGGANERMDDLLNDLCELKFYCERHSKLPKENSYSGGKSAAYQHVFDWLSKILTPAQAALAERDQGPTISHPFCEKCGSPFAAVRCHDCTSTLKAPLEFIISQRNLTFAECSLAEEIVERASKALRNFDIQQAERDKRVREEAMTSKPPFTNRIEGAEDYDRGYQRGFAAAKEMGARLAEITIHLSSGPATAEQVCEHLAKQREIIAERIRLSLEDKPAEE